MKRKISMAQFIADENRELNIVKAEKMISQAASEGSKLICFPEVCFDRFFPQERARDELFDLAEPIPGPITERLMAKAKSEKIVVVASLLEEGFAGEYYDSAICIDADGSLLGTTRMNHSFEGENYNEKFYYAPGNTLYPVYNTAAGPVGIAICQDSWYPEVMRILSMKGAELIVVPTAESCPEEKFDWYQDVLTTVQAKAPSICNGVFVGVANRVGVEKNMNFMGSSYVTNPFGKIIKMANRNDDEVLTVEIDSKQIKEARRIWPLLRDRRPETYDYLTKQWGSQVKYNSSKVFI